jgi:hypothetical protein
MKESAEWTGREMAHMPAQDLLWRSGPMEGVPCKTAGTLSYLETGDIYEVGGEALGRSLGRIILNGPLILLR